MNSEWHKDFSWGVWEPASWWNNVTLLALASRAKWTHTLEIGVGQYLNGVYLLGMHAKAMGSRHTAIDISGTNLVRAEQVIAHYDLPVDLLAHDSKAVRWNRRVQLVYVDGAHDYEQVRGDIENYARWMTRNGLMVFDDYFKLHHRVKEAVDDAFKEYGDRFEMMVLPAQGWAIWHRL